MISVNKYNVIDQNDSADLKVKDGKKYEFEIGKIFVKVRILNILNRIFYFSKWSKYLNIEMFDSLIKSFLCAENIIGNSKICFFFISKKLNLFNNVTFILMVRQKKKI